MVNFLTISTLIIYAIFSIYMIIKFCDSVISSILIGGMFLILGYIIIKCLRVLVGLLGNHPVLFVIVFFWIVLGIISSIVTEIL